MFKLIRLVTLLALGSSSALSFATGFQDCPSFFPNNTPPVLAAAQANGPVLRELCYDAFALAHSSATKTPYFVVEKLTRAQLVDAADEERTNKFFADARLPEKERATLADYAKSGFDRGHMAPAGDMPNAQAMAQSFSLANMVPQAPTNNRKTWKKLESDTRNYVRRAAGPVYVYSGPLYDKRVTPVILGNGLKVPTHLFKLVYDPTANKSWVHILENKDTAKIGKPLSYAEFVKATRMDLLGTNSK